MLEISVVSEPSALNPGRYFWDIDLEALGRYDTQLVKPALLLADKVKLISFREDMRIINHADAFQNSRMPVRFIFAYAALSLRRDPGELELLGIRPHDLAATDECEALFDGSPFDEFESKHTDGIWVYRQALARVLRDRDQRLNVDELNAAVQQNVLEQVGWLPADDNLALVLNWIDRDNDLYAMALGGLAEKLNPSTIPLVEPGAEALISLIGSDRICEVTPVHNRGLQNFAPVASALVTQLPGLSNLTVSEILDLRNELSDYLPAFRSAVVELSEEISAESDATSHDLARKVEYAWHKRIHVVLQEIREQARQATYSRHVLDTFAQDKASLTSAGSSLVLAAGTTVAGIATFVPAVAAAAYPFLRALNERRKATDALHTNKLFFLHAINERLRRKR